MCPFKAEFQLIDVSNLKLTFDTYVHITSTHFATAVILYCLILQGIHCVTFCGFILPTPLVHSNHVIVSPRSIPAVCLRLTAVCKPLHGKLTQFVCLVY